MSGLRFQLSQLRPEMRAQVERSLALAKDSGLVRTIVAGVEAKKPKYLNAPRVVLDGRFDSKLEEREYRKLQARQACGQIRNLRRQVRFALFLAHGELLQIFKADFVFEELQGGKWAYVVADAKSKFTKKLPEWAKVKRLMLANHNIAVRELP